MGVIGILQCHGDAVVNGIDGNARHIAVGKGSVLFLHERLDIEFFRRAEAAVCVDREDVEDGLLSVDDVRLAVVGVVGDDLGDAAVRIDLAQLDAARLLQGERGVLFEAVFLYFICRLTGDAFALAVEDRLVFGHHFRIIKLVRVGGVVVGIREVYAAHRLFLGLYVLVSTLIDGRDLCILGIVPLHGEHIHIALGSVLVGNGARKRVGQRDGAVEKRHRDALVVQLHVPLHIPFGDEESTRGDLVRLPAAHEIVPLGGDAAFKHKGQPFFIVLAVRARAVGKLPAREGDCRFCGVVKFDEAVADDLRVVRSAEHLTHDDVGNGDIVAAVLGIGRTRKRLRPGDHGKGSAAYREAERGTHRRGGDPFYLFHIVFSYNLMSSA